MKLRYADSHGMATKRPMLRCELETFARVAPRRERVRLVEIRIAAFAAAHREESRARKALGFTRTRVECMDGRSAPGAIDRVVPLACLKILRLHVESLRAG